MYDVVHILRRSNISNKDMYTVFFSLASAEEAL